MIINTPPLGWNSWNTFGKQISDEVIRETARAMVDSGLRDIGYDYVIIDDCWAEKERDENGRLVPDPEKFPNGIKALAEYVHSLGLKFGIYSCAGDRTCADYPGSFDHEFIDAETFAEWDVDYLKYDYCFRPRETPGHILYKRMGTALANCGRDIVFAACSWGADNTREWIKTTGAHTWRSTGDIYDSWESIKKLAMQQTDIQSTNGLGCFNDMDMLVVGMGGKGNVGLTGCANEEYKLHFSLWALLCSPLIIGCDIRNMDDAVKNILTNEKVLKINQDPAARQAYMINSHGDRPIWVRALSNGDFAIGLFNYNDTAVRLHFSIADLGLNCVCGKKLELEDVWTDEIKEVDGLFCDTLPAHGFRLFRGRVRNL